MTPDDYKAIREALDRYQARCYWDYIMARQAEGPPFRIAKPPASEFKRLHDESMDALDALEKYKPESEE